MPGNELAGFFKPNHGTRQWELILANPNQKQLNWMLSYNVNPKDVSFLTLVDMVRDKINSQEFANAIRSLVQLANRADQLLQEPNVVWKNHSLRRVIAGIKALKDGFTAKNLSNEVEKECLDALAISFLNLWKNKNISAPLVEKLNQLVRVIYKESFERWRNYNWEVNSESSIELKFWQELVVGHLQTMSYLDTEVSLTNRLKELRLQYALQWVHKESKNFAEVESEINQKMIDDFVRAYQEDALDDDLLTLLSHKIRNLYDNCQDKEKSHLSAFYHEAVEQELSVWQKGSLAENSSLGKWLKGWLKSVLFEKNSIKLADETRQQLQNLSIEKLIQEYKHGQYKDRALGLLLDSALPRLHEERSVEKVHSSGEGELSVLVVARLLQEWRNQDLVPSNPVVANDLLVIALEPWENRLTMLQAMLLQITAPSVDKINENVSLKQ